MGVMNRQIVVQGAEYDLHEYTLMSTGSYLPITAEDVDALTSRHREYRHHGLIALTSIREGVMVWIRESEMLANRAAIDSAEQFTICPVCSCDLPMEMEK